MGNMQISRTGLGYIKRRKRFNDERQQNCQELLEVIWKAESEAPQKNQPMFNQY